MACRVLLFGRTGKMGTALARLAPPDHEIVGVNSRDLDVADFRAVRALVKRVGPDLVVNAVARLGIDDCEKNPMAALRVNALFPGLLAELAAGRDAALVHLSSEAVFSGEKGDFLTEADRPDPVNVYGCSKYMGELAVAAAAPRHHIFRLPILFGPCARRAHLVERTIDRARAGERRFRFADDVVTSPTSSLDAAAAIWRALAEGRPFGLYHVANSGHASLYGLMAETFSLLGLKARVEPAAAADFPGVGRKNTVTPLAQTRLPELRPWRAALADHCRSGEA